MSEQLNWVATTDELPDEGITVLLFGERYRCTCVGYIYRVFSRHVGRTMEGNVIKVVTHWAEMPSGPRVEAEK